jgi:cell division protein FtsL
MVTTWNLFVFNYLHIAAKKQDTIEKFENVCRMSIDTIKTGVKVSICILVIAFLALGIVSMRLIKNTM